MVPFIKLHALGNDFILIKDNFNKITFKKNDIIRLCHRKYGVGADGIIVIKPAIDKTLVKFYNSDATEPEMCINGVRCIAYVLKEVFPEKNIFQLVLPKRMVEVTVKKYDNKLGISYVEINLGNPKFDYYGKKFPSDKPSKVKTSFGNIEGYYISFDNPHFVTFVNSKFTIQNSKLQFKDKGLYGELNSIGKECQTIFGKGINVEFVNVRNLRNIDVLFWERGVGWTDSCGSGSCAVGVVLKRHLFNNADEFFIKSVGGTVKVKVDRHFNTYLEGESQKVFEGYLS